MQGIVFFLNGARGLAVLQAVVEAGHGVTRAVVPEGSDSQAVFLDTCSALTVPLMAVRCINDQEFVQAIADSASELLVVAGFSTIFREPLLNAARLGAINLHAGPLPGYRGGSPLNWQLINDEQAAGISVIQMNSGIDTGDILAESEFAIVDSDTIATLHERANAKFPRLVLDVLAGLESGNLRRQQQDPCQARYWHQRNDEDGRIDWHTSSARQVYNLIRAITRPYPGAFFEYEGRRFRAFAATLPEIDICGSPGRVCYLQREGPYVICADRALLLHDLEDDGGGAPRLPHGAHLS